MPLDVRNDVDYRAIACRSCLNRQSNPRLPFRYTINPYRGCELGCAYCYARYTHEFMELRDWLDFERKIFVKADAPEHLERELARPAVRREPIALGAATDPYQPAERRFGLTRRILEVIARHRGLRFSLITKSDLVLRDIDLLRAIGKRSRLDVSITVTTTDRDLARRLEPRAPTPEKRLRAVRALREAGISAGISGCPILPFVNDSEERVTSLFAAARDAGARFLFFNVLFLMDSAKKRYFPFIEQEFPEVAERFKAMYRGPYAPAEYQERLHAMIERVRERFGIPAWGGDDPERVSEPLREVQGAFPWA